MLLPRSVLPSRAAGVATDIGAALDTAIDRLERADASDVQVLIFLTDGQHRPRPSSAYPSTSGPAWDTLEDRATVVEGAHDLQVLGAGLSSSGGTDINVLRNVFASPELNSLPASQLGGFFQDAVRRSRVARLVPLLDEELANTVRVQPVAEADLDDRMEVTIPLDSSFEKLPVDVEISGVTVSTEDGDDVDAELTGDATFRILPGEPAGVDVLIEPDIEDPGFTVPEELEELEFRIQLDASYRVEPNQVLRRLTASPSRGPVEGVQRLEAARTNGLSWLALLLRVGALLLLLWIFRAMYKRYLQLPKLVGVFERQDPGVSDEDRTIHLRGKRMSLGRQQVPEAGTAKVDLYTKRGKPNRLYAEVDVPPFYEGSRRREVAVTDWTEVKYGDYRLGPARLKYLARASSRSKTSTRS